MKRICVFLMICFTFNFSYTGHNFAAAKNENITYAKAGFNCVLFKTSSLEENLNNIYFIIPETYFVSVLENLTDDIAKVQYANYIGYVKSSTITICTFIPIVKSLENITFDIKETSGTQIWSIPSIDGNVLTVIPAGTKSVLYIASTFGEIPLGGESNVWIYATYTSTTNKTNVYEGYVYSENITNLSEIVANAETNPESVSKDTLEPDKTIYVSSTIKTVLIVLIAIPVITLFALILLKIVKFFSKKTNKNRFSDLNSNSKLEQEDEFKNHFEKFKNMRKLKKDKNNYFSNFPDFDSNEDDLL